MRSSMGDHHPLRGATVLVAGGATPAVDALTSALTEAGAERVLHVPDPAARSTAPEPRPDAIVVLDDTEAGLHDRLDPFGLGGGPLLVGAQELEAGPGLVLALRLERHALRLRLAELEGVVAAGALTGRRIADAAEQDALRHLAVAADYRDDNSHEHTERVAHLAALLGRELALAPRTLALLRRAAPLHDVGKIAVPDSILLKPDRLEPDEFEVVRTHAAVGARILSGGDSALFATAAEIARSHHERWDGAGYPEGLSGERVPLVGRLVAVADVFDVLVHERPYKEEWTALDAAAEIRRGAGTQFDPEVVAAFDALGERAWTSSPGPLP